MCITPIQSARFRHPPDTESQTNTTDENEDQEFDEQIVTVIGDGVSNCDVIDWLVISERLGLVCFQ